MHLFEKQVSSETIFEGKIITVKKDKAVLEDGTNVTREVVEHNGGVCVIPITNDGYIYLVKQFRYPLQEVLLEVPAGKINKGEDPFECGKRELLEEVGISHADYTDLGVMYPSCGYTNEHIYLYMAEDLKFEKQQLDEGEFLDVVKISFQEAFDKVMNNEIRDGKTQLAILKAARILKDRCIC